MRVFRTLSAFSLLLLLTACGKNEVNLPQNNVKGKMKGVDWEYKFANGYLFSSDLKYRMLFLSTNEPGSDPCSVPSTSNPHLSIVVNPRVGSYSLPFPVNSETARFNLGPGDSRVATSGFLEIFNVIDGKVIGYIQAQLDNDNKVEGRFEARLCN